LRAIIAAEEVLTDNTVIRDEKGLFGLDKQHLSSVVLIPGLKVEVDGTSDEQGRVVAKTITTDGDGLETAEMRQRCYEHETERGPRSRGGHFLDATG
jgi:hypothetical protein